MSDSRVIPMQDVKEPEFRDLCVLVYNLTKQVERLTDQVERVADSQEKVVVTAEHFLDCMCDEGEFSTLQISIYEP